MDEKVAAKPVAPRSDALPTVHTAFKRAPKQMAASGDIRQRTEHLKLKVNQSAQSRVIGTAGHAAFKRAAGGWVRFQRFIKICTE